MLQVHVRYKSVVQVEILSGLREELPRILSDWLSFQGFGGFLSPEKIVVFFDRASALDASPYDLHINVDATHFPELDKGSKRDREESLERRVEGIVEKISAVLDAGLSFGVRVELARVVWKEGVSITLRERALIESGM